MPKEKPERPSGVERNVVISLWEWSTEYSSDEMPILDPKTIKYNFLDTCFATHHPQFGYDADDTIWFSGTGPVATRW